jgi:putative transcriptional regulator
MVKVKAEYRSDIAKSVHEGVRAMHWLGLVDKKTMREFDLRCLTSVEELSARDIQKLRK